MLWKSTLKARDETTRRALAMEAFARLSDAEKVDFVRWVLGDLSFLTGEDMAKLVKEVILDGT